MKLNFLHIFLGITHPSLVSGWRQKCEKCVFLYCVFHSVPAVMPLLVSYKILIPPATISTVANGNAVLLQAQVPGPQAERGPSPHQPPPTSRADHQLLNAEPPGAAQQRQSASVSPPPRKVELLSPVFITAPVWNSVGNSA